MCISTFATFTTSVAAQTNRSVPDTIAERVRACTVCHGKEGRATNHGYFPRIAGKPAGYLYNQLINFREGRRQYDAMNQLVVYLSNDYLKEIAEYFAAIEVPYPAPLQMDLDDRTLAQGERLVRKGDASRKIPACVGCHDQALTGVAPNVPGLIGLPRDYMHAQLGAWRSGQRRAAHPDCMAEIAKRLAPNDISAITAWIASRPIPRLTSPAKTMQMEPPIPCGSIAGN